MGLDCVITACAAGGGRLIIEPFPLEFEGYLYAHGHIAYVEGRPPAPVVQVRHLRHLMHRSAIIPCDCCALDCATTTIMASPDSGTPLRPTIIGTSSRGGTGPAQLRRPQAV